MAEDSDDRNHETNGKPAYEVGYGKPPQASRFKPGTSGNPKGRRKETQNFSTYLRQELAASVAVNKDGKSYRMPKVQLIATQLVTSAIKGNLKSIETLMKLAGIMNTPDGSAEAGTSHALSAQEAKMMTDYLSAIIGNGGKVPAEDREPEGKGDADGRS